MSIKKLFLVGAAALAAIVAGLSHAEMSQVPLVTAGSSVPPNLMFTIDDSGSMDFECIPDSLCYDGSNNEVDVMPWGLSGKSGAATVDENHIYNRQMRSPQINGVYYDPTVRYQPWIKEDGTRYPTYPITAAPLDPTSGTTVNLATTQTLSLKWCTDNNSCATSSKSYFPAKYYSLTSGTGSATANFTVTVIRGAGTTYTKTIDGDRTDCAATTYCTLAEEQQNFSNWFTYASNRMLAAKGGTSEAFYNLPKSYRVGYGRINDTTATSIDGVSTKTIVRGLRPFDGSDRADFYTWLVGVTPNGGTPLRRAMDDVGQYFSRSDNRGPWGAVPGTNDTTDQLTCRKTFHILMTDGGWNGDEASTSGANTNVDGNDGSTITGPNSQSYKYTKAYPYRDSTSKTLADVAMYYWYRDLRTDLANDVKPTTGNPAFWQHMVNYTIAFGQKGNLNNPGDLAALTANTKNWGTPSTSANNLANIDDLWHAALNSRGLNLSAQNPLEYANALRAIINDIDDRTGSEAGVAVSGRFLQVGSRKYVPEYRTGNWTGQLSAVTLDDQANDDQVVWRAGDKLPPWGSRNIFTFKDTTTKGITFTWAALSTNSMTSNFLVTSADGTGLIAYLRGDASQEGSKYRTRGYAGRINTTTLPTLGDIVNSSPVWVKDLVDMQYDFLPSTSAGRTTYREFLRNKKYRVPLVVVGANDGMVHAFSDASGTETFAYFPQTILPELKHLGDMPYIHQYYVDGPMMETDVYDTSATKWRNLVVGSTGAGGKAVFAINMPVASSPTGTATLTTSLLSPGASDILWEINDSGSFSELGYVLSQAEAGQTRDGSWVVIFGNGYESASGNAQLFIVNALTGALIKRIDTGVGGGNGLGGVRVVRDTKQQIVAAYAGDLKGNMWKFDLSGTTTGSWGVAFGGTPLYNAVNRTGNAEPFTAAPTYVLHPLGGVLVLAGSGKLYETADPDNKQERTLYGLWDKVKVGNPSATASFAITGTAQLVMQQVSSTLVVTTTAGDTTTYYTSTSNPVNYGTKRGWYMPMTIQAGQRLIYDPQVAIGRVFFETVVPGAAVTTCSVSNGLGYNFVFDPFSGAAGGDGPTFDTNGDGIINSSDVSGAVGYKTNADGGDGILLKTGSKAIKTGDDACTVSSATCNCVSGTCQKVSCTASTATCTCINGFCEQPRDACSQAAYTIAPGSSKQVCGDKNAIRRNWRQLINPPS